MSIRNNRLKNSLIFVHYTSFYNLSLSANISINWFKTIPQFWIGILHFLVASLSAKKTDF